MIEIPARYVAQLRLKRRSRNSGIEKTLERKEKGTKTQPSRRRMQEACHSKLPPARPDVAPEPASPMKCSGEILETNSDAPMANQPILRPARKYSSELRSLREK